MKKNGVYYFWKGNQKVCECTFANDKLTTVKHLTSEAYLPPFVYAGYGKENKVLTALQQFFAYRFLPVSHMYYNLAKEWEDYHLFSLLDDYAFTYPQETFSLSDWKQHYSFKEDSFVRKVLYQSQLLGGISPNVILPFPALTFIEIKEDKRILLQEYNKELVEYKKRRQIPYELAIYGDIPFLATVCPDGNLFPLETVFSKQVRPCDREMILSSYLKDGEYLKKDDFGLFFHVNKEGEIHLIYL